MTAPDLLGTELDPRFRQLLETLPVGVYTCNARGLITYYNSMAARLWGSSPALNDPSERWCAFHGGDEIVIERPDGNRVTVLAHTNPLHDGAGRVVGTINVLVDISDRKRAEAAMARLGAIVESSDDAIVGMTLEGRITSWNRGAEQLFGYTAEEAVGRAITLIVPEDRLDEEQAILARLRRGERVDHFDTVRRTKDGRLLDISLTTSPIYDDGRVIGASKVARDVTARKAAEADLRRLHEELRAADQAKNDFLAMLSHELRNPLAPISNAVATLQLTSAKSSELRQPLSVIERQTRQLTRLIDDLLDVSRITSNKLELRRERADLAEVLLAAVEASRPLLVEKGHDFGVDLPPEPLVLDLDVARLAQVISNLLNNAAKYTGRGGRIRLAARREGTTAVISVRDNGIGIPPGMTEKVFDMFAQAGRPVDESQSGLGIGLHLARRLVEMHGGTLTASSAGTGQGSEFTVRLALASAPAPRPKPSELPKLGQGSGLRILVVDDNRDAADSLGSLLELAGNRVRIAYDGQHAVATAEEFQPDVALLDIGLPRLNGYDVARQLRQQNNGRNLTLIALTGWGQEEAKQRSREAGFDAHLVKPVHPSRLMHELSLLHRAEES